MKKVDQVEDEEKPDPLTQLVTTFCRGAMTERSGALQEDPLYMSYAQIISKSCGEEEEEGGDAEGGEGGEEESGASIHVKIIFIFEIYVIITITFKKLSLLGTRAREAKAFILSNKIGQSWSCRNGTITHISQQGCS